MRQAYCLYQRVCCSNREFSGPGMQRRKKACRRAGPLADGAYGTGFVNFKIQNRELPYASQRSKPGKVQIKSLSRWNKFVVQIKQACGRVGLFAAV